MAVEASVMVAHGIIKDYNSFTESLKQSPNCISYKPDHSAVELLNKIYKDHKRIYSGFKSIG
jgi:hypothetical protein